MKFLESSFEDDSSLLNGDFGTGDMSDEFLFEFKKVEFDTADSLRLFLSVAMPGSGDIPGEVTSYYASERAEEG